MKTNYWAALLLLGSLALACNNENTAAKEIISVENKTDPAKTDKPVVSLFLDGRLIETTDYSCSWVLNSKMNLFSLTVHYDREPKKIPPSVSFSIYHLQNISAPLIPFYGKKISNKEEQLYTLGANLYTKEKTADMNEISFSDNYPGLSSVVQLSLLDTTAKLASGSFEGVLQNANGRNIKITAARFERIPLQMIYSTKGF